MAFDGTEIVVCEGDSERAYINELNRLLYRDPYGYPMQAFSAVPVGTGHFNEVKRTYLAERRANRSSTVVVWVDWDIYLRNDRQNGTKYRGKQKIPDFYFSVMNFEDFLMLHCSREQLDSWVDLCASREHYAKPMHADEYEPLVRQYWPSYRKGELPFELTAERVQKMFQNIQVPGLLIRNDFGQYVFNQVQAKRLKFYYLKFS